MENNFQKAVDKIEKKSTGDFWNQQQHYEAQLECERIKHEKEIIKINKTVKSQRLQIYNLLLKIDKIMLIKTTKV